MTAETEYEDYHAPSGWFLSVFIKAGKKKNQFWNECANYNWLFFKEANLLYKKFYLHKLVLQIYIKNVIIISKLKWINTMCVTNLLYYYAT